MNLPPEPHKLQGFHPSQLPQDRTSLLHPNHFHRTHILSVPRVTPTSKPIVPEPRTGPEIVLFVGSPALGKTSFYQKHFYPAGYVHVNQDTLKTRDKCLRAVEEAVEAGQSAVVGTSFRHRSSAESASGEDGMLTRECGEDNTNRDAATRQLYVELAKKHDVPIR